MRFVLLLAFLAAAAGCDSQDPFDADGEPYAAADVDVQAAPAGGYDAVSDITEYPRLARDAGISGRVVLSGAVVPGDGVVDAIVQATPSDLLSAAALKGVREARWTPARIGAREVAAEIEVCIDFRLTDDRDEDGNVVGEITTSACSDA